MFYIKKPRGNVTLHVLENSVYSRFEYLKLLDEGKGTEDFSGNFEYLLENSTWDSVGHFTLRLIAAASDYLWSFWIRTEALLFSQRLDRISPLQLSRLISNIEENLKDSEIDSSVSQALIGICKLFQQDSVSLDHITSSHDENCSQYQCQVPFTTVTRLVKERKVEIRRGNAIITCSVWKNALLCIFECFLNEEKKRIPQARYLVGMDPKLLQLKKILEGMGISEPSDERYITMENIEFEANYFPLCMQNLYRTLRDKHRLSHEARYQFTGFLRECGMTVEDSIEFWKEEYQKPHSCGAGCTHDWEQMEKRYEYSIQHIYGLVGRKRVCKSLTCRKICDEPMGVRYEGGCPFQKFDRDTLGNLLENSMNVSEVQKFLGELMNSPEENCANFFKIVHGYDGRDFQITSPFQFYKKIKDHKSRVYAYC